MRTAALSIWDAGGGLPSGGGVFVLYTHSTSGFGVVAPSTLKNTSVTGHAFAVVGESATQLGTVRASRNPRKRRATGSNTPLPNEYPVADRPVDAGQFGYVLTPVT